MNVCTYYLDNEYGLMEIFRDIPWYEWRYQVSNMWRLRSTRWDKMLCDIPNRYWYYHNILCKDRIRKTVTRHSLVLLTFVWERPDGYEINHKNGVRTDNRLENLEYCTKSENELHKYRVLGTQIWNKGVFWWDNPQSKPVLQLDKEWKLIKEWWGVREIARKTWYDNSSISKTCRWVRKTAYGFIWKYK